MKIMLNLHLANPPHIASCQGQDAIFIDVGLIKENGISIITPYFLPLLTRLHPAFRQNVCEVYKYISSVLLLI